MLSPQAKAAWQLGRDISMHTRTHARTHGIRGYASYDKNDCSRDRRAIRLEVATAKTVVVVVVVVVVVLFRDGVGSRCTQARVIQVAGLCVFGRWVQSPLPITARTSYIMYVFQSASERERHH